MIKLKAFTVLEMLINIMIMSIIIGMVYYMYSSLTEQFFNYQYTLDEENNSKNFYLLLKRDFFEAEKVLGDENAFTVYFYNNNFIEYELRNSFLYREQGSLIDSIHVKGVAIEKFDDMDFTSLLIRKITIRMSHFDKTLDFQAIKKYNSKINHSLKNGG